MNLKFKISIFLILLGGIIIFSGGCVKDKETAPVIVHETGTMTDIDGNIYKTIKIGNQWWMAEDLKVRKYRDGTYLFAANANTNISTWDTLATGAFCAYDDDINDSIGYLYNWYAISNTADIAPVGWHIPTDEEWKEMERSLGMSSSEADKSGWRGTHEGEKLKIEGEQGWTKYGDVWPTNESGFTAMAGGCRMFNGTSVTNEWSAPHGQRSVGFWWTATEGLTAGEALYRYLDYKNANVFRSSASKNYGFSIRCVKD